MVATKTAYQKAIDKAEAMGGARNIISRRGDVFTVRGSVAPTTYSVLLERPSMELHCGCPAGSRDLPCWHAATCWLALKGEQAARTYASEPLNIRRPMVDELDGVSAYDLLVGAGR